MENREIKFRAWDGSKLYDPVTLETMLGITETAYRLEPKGWTFSKQNIWMQFTGLKDSKGVEIYEGDIVNLFQKEIAEVIFDNACFRTPFNNSKYRLGGWPANKIEVIGNIYETPELLTQTIKHGKH